MAGRYVRSIFWLCAFSGLGYGLLIFATPSESQVKKIRKELPGIEKNPKEVSSKNQQFFNILQSATESDKPLYRMTKEEIDRELKSKH